MNLAILSAELLSLLLICAAAIAPALWGYSKARRG